MKVSELGEFCLIDLVASLVSRAQQHGDTASLKPLVGIGDDAAAFKVKGSIQLATSDCFVEGVHFTRDIAPWYAIGYRALAGAISDIAAMGGRPLYTLSSLALPKDTEVESVNQLCKGMLEVAGQYEVTLAGGDMSKAPLVMLDIAVIGEATGKKPLTRSGARPGQKVAITGSLGGSAAGLKMLKGKMKPDVESEVALEKAFLYPQPRIEEGQLLAESGATAAIDISDGLLADLEHMLKASKVCTHIELDKIPVNEAAKKVFPKEALAMALGGGEDYELLFTANEKVIEKMKKRTNTPITVIGEITEGETGEVSLLDNAGNMVKPPQVGWEHFGRK